MADTKELNSNSIIVSIVICTYNRSKLLDICLRSLQGQSIDKCLFEVIVIDNNSTDDTLEVAQSFREVFPHFHLIKEPKQGLSHARNRGWQEAKGEYVAYIDDDAKAHHNWVSEMLRFTKEHPEIEVFGGPYYRYSTEPLPAWFPEEYGTYYLGDIERLVEIPGECLNGTNMAYKKNLLAHFNGFNHDLGMRGTQLGYGEETELLKLMHENGIAIFYCPNMKVDHLVAQYKISLLWLLRSAYHSGFSWGKMQKTSGLVKGFLRIPYRAIRGTVLFFTLGKTPFRRRVYYSYRDFFGSCGLLRAMIDWDPNKTRKPKKA